MKIFHNKKTYGDKLLCGYPLIFTRFQTLTAHTASSHYGVVGIGARFLPIQLRLWSRLSPFSILRKSADKHGVGVPSDAASLFAPRLRSNPKFHYQPLTILINVVRILIHQQCVP